MIALARTLATETTERHLPLWVQILYGRTITELGASGDIDTDDPTTHVSRRRGERRRDQARLLRRRGYCRPGHHLSQRERHGGHVGETDQSHAGRAPPSYQLGPDDVNSLCQESTSAGYYWGPRGSVQKGSLDESGLLLANEVDLPVMPGKSATTHFATTIPDAILHDQLRLIFVPQPRLPRSPRRARSSFGNANHSTEIPDQDHHVDLGISTDLAHQVT